MPIYIYFSLILGAKKLPRKLMTGAIPSIFPERTKTTVTRHLANKLNAKRVRIYVYVTAIAMLPWWESMYMEK